MVYSLLGIVLLCGCGMLPAAEAIRCVDIADGGWLDEDCVIRSSVLIKKDLFVEKSTTLTVNPGVHVRFSPGVMLAVNGTLKAEGTDNARIKFTNDPSTITTVPQWPTDIRLVDEWSVAFGRLQLLYQGKWRGVCANSVNWTQADVDVTCNQLGFKNGSFSFVSWSRNDTDFMLYHKPGCEGSESNILDCPNKYTIQIGHKICVQQQTVHLHCEGMAPSNPAANHWWGIELYNATYKLETNGNIRINESASTLVNVDIEYAGMDPTGQPVPALRASPTPPHLIGVTIKNCALDGTNFTDIKASTIVHDSEISNNRGNGLVVESHLGRIHITDSLITDNRGNGIKTKLLDGNYPIFDETLTFCRRPDFSGAEQFPIMITGIPSEFAFSCTKKFQTMPDDRITLSFIEMDIEPEATAMLEIYDSYNQNGALLQRINIMNGTLPTAITSTYEHIYMVFSWTQPPSNECPTLFDCVKFTLLLDSYSSTKPEFFMNNTEVSNNTQHGVFVENVRSYVMVNSSKVLANQYGAGFRVYGGAGDIHVNASLLDSNLDNGVNITYDGGLRIFNMSSFSYNHGNGINITLNETSVDNRTRYANQQITEVSKSDFIANDGFGVRVGNYCRSHEDEVHRASTIPEQIVKNKVAVNDSRFINNMADGVNLESCFMIIPEANMTNFTVADNMFDNNHGHGVRINPLLNAVGRIANNTFINHKRHAMLLDNTDDFLKSREYSVLPVQYEIMGNAFRDNEGFYVASVRLTQGSTKQWCDFKFNTFIDNIIQGRTPFLNERTKAYAVVLISSSNVNFSRNHLENPESRFELATMLLDKSSTLGCTRQWWGTREYEAIIPRIFDQYNRYNLAIMDYHPVLKEADLNTNFVTDEEPPIYVDFSRGDYLGGRLDKEFRTVEGKSYFVDRDISIMSDGRFLVSPGTKLEFHNALGMYVEGLVHFDGKENNRIEMYLANEESVVNHTSVRLVDGPDGLEGRLEVKPEGEDKWGTVCGKGWTIVDSAVVCQMLGNVVHPDDWLVFANIPGDDSMPIWRSSVDCTDLDMNILDCFADGVNDHSCNHTEDIYIKCKRPTWAGIQFAAKASSSTLVYTSISYAGLMDPAAILYSPAIKIAYNTHTLENLIIENNMADGLEIMKNDVFSNTKLSHSIVRNNFGNGVASRTSFFEIYFCTLQGNTKAGFEYNPHYTTYEAQQIRFGIHEPIVLNQDLIKHRLPNSGREFVTTEQKFEMEENKVYMIEITVENEHRVNMDIIDYNPRTENENVTVYESEADKITENTMSWTLEDDLVDFPITSAGNVLTVKWTVNGMSSGRFAFVVRSKHYDWRWPFGLLQVTNTTTEGNKNGIITRHYNQPSDEFLDLFFRYRWETIRMYGVTFRDNIEDALKVPSLTKYNELYMPTFEELQIPEKLAEIHYELESNLFLDNGGGLIGEHNHVEFSNNVWIWEVNHNHFEGNRDGGFMIELPKVNLMYTELYNHSVNINGTVFENNDNFAFRVDGFYCNSSIVSNRWSNNRCKVGCITIAGTEKDFEMTDNQIYDNRGKYIMEFNIQSHTPYTRWVDAQMQYNDIKRNRPLDSGDRSISSTPTSYAFGVKGLQNITINRNLFDNDMDYELVGGQASSSLENYLDVTENYWGSIDQEEIRNRIFDFDNWNSYAIAEYYPYLLSDDYNGLLSTGGKYDPVFDPTKPLGGRIDEDTVLPYREEPYIVERDLTVMPDCSLRIEPGVELQFYPNIGILVLGSLSAIGKSDQRIRFNPIAKSDITPHSRKKRLTSVEVLTEIPEGDGMHVRLIGGETEYDGWIEIYNSTERRWAMVCDDSFNDRTAEVACKTMGKEYSNVLVTTHRYYDIYVLGYPKMHEQVIEWFWRRTFICDGTETDLDQCRFKQNYHLYRCMEARDYMYVRCGPRNLADDYDYWGNLRFSTPEYEHGNIFPGFSAMDYVDIYGAGILHEERVAAVQSIHRVPTTSHVTISHCNWNGYDYIAPRDEYSVTFNTIENNNGYAIGGLVLNGESRYDVPQSSFVPLIPSAVPYNVYGLVRMCSTEKLIYVQDRLLLYYKYVFDTVDCIKVLRSKEPRKQIALRFLQLNMYNDSFYENSVEMYNGEYFDPASLIGKVDANSSHYERSIKYETSEYFDTMGIRITASPAYGVYGFIAEVVTLPLSPGWRPELGPGIRQTISDCSISNNERGAFMFMNAGELNPSVIIEQNHITDNGLGMLNITSPPIMDFYVQNTRLMTIANNYIAYNYGSVIVNTTSNSLSNALYANITNNFIAYNSHGEALHIEGHYFQGFDVRDNYIAFNQPSHRNVIAMFGVSLNFSTNIIFNNTARCILNASVPDQVGINQRYFQNSIYENWAFAENRSTIFLKSAKFSFRDNYLINRHNRYEIVTFNRTKYPDGTYPQVNAANNWWGGDVESFVAGRIWERRDDDNLIEVMYSPFYTSNASVLNGKCDPGWRQYASKCYWYFGGVVDYATADKHCRILQGRLAKARDRDWERAFNDIVIQFQENYHEYWYTWVYSDWQKGSSCTSLRNGGIRHIDCNEMHTFLCEKDPFPQVTLYWRPIIIALGCTGGMFIIIILVCCCGTIKSHQRKNEKLSRRSHMKREIAASKASLFSGSRAGTSSGLVPHDIQQQKRRRPPLTQTGEEPAFFDITGATMEATSTDSIDRLKYMDSHRPYTPASSFDLEDSKLGSSSYFDSDLGPVRQRPQYPQRVENEITSYNPNRSRENVFRNEAYDDDISVVRGRNKGPSTLGSNPQKRYSGGADLGGAYGGYAESSDGYPESTYAPSTSGYPESTSGYPKASRGYLTSTGGASGYSVPDSGRTQESGGYVKPPRPRPKESAM